MKKNLRIYSTENLKKGKLTLNKKQSHYLKNVMRIELKDKISIFNEKDGEWFASIISIKKNECSILIEDFIKASAIEVFILSFSMSIIFVCSINHHLLEVLFQFFDLL